MNSQGQKIEVSILIIKEKDSKGKNRFIAQCMEYDMTAQGKTIRETQNNIHKMLITQILIDSKRETSPLSQFQKAPKDLQKLFKSAKSLEHTITLTSLTPDKIKDFPTLEIKEWKFYEFNHRFFLNHQKSLKNSAK